MDNTTERYEIRPAAREKLKELADANNAAFAEFQRANAAFHDFLQYVKRDVGLPTDRDFVFTPDGGAFVPAPHPPSGNQQAAVPPAPPEPGPQDNNDHEHDGA